MLLNLVFLLTFFGIFTELLRNYLESFVFNPKIQDPEITSLPRRVRRKRKKKKKNRKVTSEKSNDCDHCFNHKTFQCRHFKEKHVDIDKTVRNARKNFNKDRLKKREFQKDFVSRFVRWNCIKRKTLQENWNLRKNLHRYPSTFVVSLPCDGYGDHRVCVDFFRYFFNIGKTKWRNFLAEIWESRKKDALALLKTDFKEDSDVDPEWVLEYERITLSNHKLIRSHYSQRDCVCYDTENGRECNMPNVYSSFIKVYQPERWEAYIKPVGINVFLSKNKKKGGFPTIPGIPKPSPCFRHFCRVVNAKFNISFKRLSQDQCNACQHFKVALTNCEQPESEWTKEELEDARNRHLNLAAFKYQWNTHTKKHTINSWKKINIESANPVDGFYSQTWMHMEFDFDINYEEIHLLQNAQYFSSPLKCKSLNMVIRYDILKISKISRKSQDFQRF